MFFHIFTQIFQIILSKLYYIIYISSSNVNVYNEKGADEPTGNLDEETEIKIIELFKQLAKEGKCVIVVTHSKNIAKMADKMYVIKKGVMKLQ